MAYRPIAPLRNHPAAAGIFVTCLLMLSFMYIYTQRLNAPLILHFLHTLLHAIFSVLLAGRGAQRRWTLTYSFAMATFIFGYRLGMSRLDDQFRSTLLTDQRDTMAKLKGNIDNLSGILSSIFPTYADLAATITAAPEL